MAATPAAAAPRAQRAYVLVDAPPPGGELVVAGLTLAERWRRALAAIGVTAETVARPQLVAALAAADAPLVVADGRFVVEQAVLDAFRETPCEAGDIVTVAAPGDAPPAPVARLGAAAARALASALADPGSAPAVAWHTLAGGGTLRLVAEPLADPFWRLIDGPQAARHATRAMLLRLRLRPGGLAAQAVNRHVSVRLSRYWLMTSLSPNAITTVTGLVGLAAAWAMAQGGYVWGVVGAGLMQFSSILDGCDGEVARLRYQQSSFGAWYDSLWDELVNALFLVAVGYNLYLTHGAWPFLVMGIVAGGVSYLYALAHWHCKAKHGIGLYWWFDVGKPRVVIQQSRSLMSYLKKVFWRDTFLLVYFGAALTGVLLPVMLAISAGGAAITFGMLFFHIVIRRAQW